MSDSDLPKLPGAQVTPPLPAAADDADDESPTIRIDGVDGETTARWSGSATVRPPGSPASTRRVDTSDEDAYLPADDYGPTVRERLGAWRVRRRQRAAARSAAAARPAAGAAGASGTRALPATPPGTRALPQPPQLPGPPPGWYGPPPGYAPPTGYLPPAGHQGHQRRGTPAHPVRQNPPGRRPGGGPTSSRPANRPPVNPYPYPPAPPRRRRRRWPWWMLFWLLAFAACCGGVTLWARPFIDEYPASITADADVPGLSRSTDAGRQRVANQLLGVVESEQWDEESVAVLYTDQRQRGATLLATTRFVVDPKKDLTASFTRLSAQLKIREDAAVDAGDLGGFQRCGTGTLNGRTVAVCGWADHGSLAVLVTAGRSVPETATLLGTVRGAVLDRG
jgi:hypothetical protein